jgi:hypothetical protein
MNFKEATNNMLTNMVTIEAAKPTTKEFAEAIIQSAPAMQSAWDQCMGDDTLWATRAQGYGSDYVGSYEEKCD